MDRNTAYPPRPVKSKSSPPARVAWIETFRNRAESALYRVATREGGVDRNAVDCKRQPAQLVATREGGVDRNLLAVPCFAVLPPSPPARVAWIETPCCLRTYSKRRSPPARVAWIETGRLYFFLRHGEVATREGGVDRNMCISQDLVDLGPSPPARVAWIETRHRQRRGRRLPVATREGGVDRNTTCWPGAMKALRVATREGGVDRNT